jgi:hypothetical protein
VIPQGQCSYEEVIYRIIYQGRRREREREKEKAMSEGNLIHDIIGELFIQK